MRARLPKADQDGSRKPIDNPRTPGMSSGGPLRGIDVLAMAVASGRIMAIELLAAWAAHHRVGHLRRQLLAARPHLIFPRGAIAMVAPCLEVGLGAPRQEHAPRGFEVGSRLIERVGRARSVFARLRSAPFPRLSGRRVAAAHRDDADTHVAIEDAVSVTRRRSAVCNLYSVTTNQFAIIALFRVINRYVGNLPPMPGVFPDYPAPVIRNTNTCRELTMMRWGMPPPPRTPGPPVNNIRNTSSPHWRMWLKPENRCLVPANSFAEYAPETNPVTKKKDVVWFALNEDRPLFTFRRHLDDVQRRSRHKVEADPRAASGLRLPDHGAQCSRKADPSQGDAGDPDHGRGT